MSEWQVMTCTDLVQKVWPSAKIRGTNFCCSFSFSKIRKIQSHGKVPPRPHLQQFSPRKLAENSTYAWNDCRRGICDVCGSCHCTGWFVACEGLNCTLHPAFAFSENLLGLFLEGVGWPSSPVVVLWASTTSHVTGIMGENSWKITFSFPGFFLLILFEARIDSCLKFSLREGVAAFSLWYVNHMSIRHLSVRFDRWNLYVFPGL